MDLNLKITDMAGASPEHSTVIVNFVAAVRNQLKNSTCFVFSDNVQYKFKADSGEDKTVIPDASINCRTKSRRGNKDSKRLSKSNQETLAVNNEEDKIDRFYPVIDSPRFVMEVVSSTTEAYDRGEKMSLYCHQEIEEYWIVDWKTKTVEIYELDYENEVPKYYLWKTITEANKSELKILHFPNIKLTFDQLFDEVEI